jgi:hypothetical protein
VRAGIELPPVSEQETVGTFCDRPEQLDVQGMADRVYRNRQRTSSRGGILKADAVLRFARCLRQYGVATFQDLPRVATHAGFEAEIRAIPGQGSGIALSYFWMLAGSDDLIKPDRMIVRFLSNTLGREVGIGDAQDLLRAASSHLRRKHPLLTPRLLDYVVWKYQREVSEPVSAPIGG